MFIKKRMKKSVDFLIFVLPTLVLIMITVNIPFFMNLYYSLFDWNGVSKNMNFVGISNFIKIFTHDDGFASAVIFTLKCTLFYVIFVNIFALLIAIVLSRTSILSGMGRSFYYIPHIIGLIAISLVWSFLIGPGFNILYSITGLKVFEISWIGDPKFVFYTLLFIIIWQNVGFYTIIYIAGITSIPEDVLEAAEIDGANPVRKFISVKLPLIMPSITICTILSLTYSLKLFEIILAFTKGGPAGKTRTAVFDIYQEAFVRYNFGLATAKSFILFAMTLIFVIIQFRLIKSREVEL